MRHAAIAAFIASLMSPALLHAEATPRATPQDPRIREVIYDDGEVYRIIGAFRAATQIVFAPQERIEHVALGDTISWEVAPAENTLFLKPREAAGSTNLIVMTRSQAGLRTYTFALRQGGATRSERSGSSFYKVLFRYPQDEQAQRARFEARAALQAAAEAQRSAVKSALDVAVLEGPRNLKYEVQGASALQPSEISDNGQFTTLRFPGQRELPAFFAVGPDGRETIVSFDVRDDFVVIHGTYAQLRLRRGKALLCVYNNAPSIYGRDPKTNTASSLVERSTEAPE